MIKAFAFVLENTKISCDSRDIFPAINIIDRPLSDTIIEKWNKEVFEEIIREINKKKQYFNGAGIVTMVPDYDYSIPMWDRVFNLGFTGLLEDREKIRSSRTLTNEEDEFFEGIKITYNAVINLIGRLEELAKKTSGSEKMASALSNIKSNPPATFYEALLVDYIYFMLSEHIEGLQVRSLGNFDRLLYPLYRNDIENGVSEEELRTILAYFLMQFTAIGNYWNQPVFLVAVKRMKAQK